jgi:hypothetical protein
MITTSALCLGLAFFLGLVQYWLWYYYGRKERHAVFVMLCVLFTVTTVLNEWRTSGAIDYSPTPHQISETFLV